ncbi:stAR-related lipid transfer protein 6 [Tiliqua scincoides]|uniref:stAR-related lipid transfer protein 6 n=1 Tax=Tiliqua scincoides TaxID=71010 RepID=UPI00346302FE
MAAGDLRQRMLGRPGFLRLELQLPAGPVARCITMLLAAASPPAGMQESLGGGGLEAPAGRDAAQAAGLRAFRPGGRRYGARGGRSVLVFFPALPCSPGYRVEAVMEAPVEKLFPFIHLPEYRSKWDKGLQQYKVIEVIDQDTSIVHSITHSYGLGLVSPRDFVFILHIKKYEGNLLTTNSISVEHPKFPPTSQYVRGTSFPCGYAVHPLPGNPSQSKFVAILQVDLGGMLRPAVIDSAMPASLINLITDCRAGIKSLK